MEATKNINRYCLSFPFKGEYKFIYVLANEMANELLGSGDDISDFKYDEDLGQCGEHTFHHEGKEYDVEFSFDGPTMVDVFEHEDDGSGHIVERGIPYLCVAIEQYKPDSGWVTIYKLSDNV